MAKTRMPKSAGYGSVHTVRLPLWPYLITPLSVVAAIPTTFLAHRAWGDSPAVAALLTVCAIVIVAFTWRASAPRGQLMQTMATGLAALGATWVIAAVIAGPAAGPLPIVLVIGGLTASIVVAVRRVMAEGGRSETGDQLGDLGDKIKQLKGARFGRATVTGGKVTAGITMEPGDLIGGVAEVREEIASLHDVPATAVRVIPSDTSERRGRIEVVPVDQLVEPRPWPGPSRPGGSIADPIVLGVMEDSEPFELYLPGDPKAHRNATHVLIVGMSGAGKTEIFLRLAEEVLTRRDAEIWVGDARKAGQSPRWLLDGAARLATTEAEVDDMLDDLLAAVPVRSAQMGSHGHKEWMRGCPKCPPFRVVLLDEAAQIAAGNRIFVDLTESLRSVGVSMVAGLQRASHDRFPTSARSNIGTSLCLGVRDETDADMALDEDTIKAGAMPWRWKASKPGMVYAEIAGTDRRRWSMPARTFAPPASEDDRADAIAAVAGPPPARREPTGPAPVEEEAEEEPELDDEPNAALDLDDPPDDVDPAAPVTVPPGTKRVAFDPDGKPMTPAQARDELRAYLHDLANSGTTRFRAPDLSEVLYRTGMSGSWLQKALVQLTLGSAPLLSRPEHGWYEIQVEHVP